MSWEALAWAKQQRGLGPAGKLLLILLAEKAGSDWTCWPSIARLADEMECSARTVNRMLKDLEDGKLIARRRRGSQSTIYTLRMDGALGVSLPDQTDRPEIISDATDCPIEPDDGQREPVLDATEWRIQNDTQTVASNATPRVAHEHHVTPGNSTTEANASVDELALVEAPKPSRTINQQANDLAKVYYDEVPLSNFPALAKITKKALTCNRYTYDEIKDAMQRLAKDGRTVTVNTLRTELDGAPEPQYRQRSQRPAQSRKHDNIAWLLQGDSTPQLQIG